MSYLKSVLHEEYERLKALLKKYNDEISALPRGSISIKMAYVGNVLILETLNLKSPVVSLSEFCIIIDKLSGCDL